MPLLAFTSWQLVAGGLVLLPLALAVEGPPPALDAKNAVGYAWLAVVGTAAAYALWFRGIERLSVARVSQLGLLSPVVATTVGWLVLDQRLTVVQLFGAFVVLTALHLGQRPHTSFVGIGPRNPTTRRMRPSSPISATSRPVRAVAPSGATSSHS